jgi:hypothetical protein
VRRLAHDGTPVRVSGWLMLDPEHPDQVGRTRGTIWEIHPILAIEVRRGDAWRTRIDMLATMTADADDFHVASVLEAYEGDVRVHVRTASASIPRDHC